MHTPGAPVVGMRVLARREPDLEPEEGVIKKVRTTAGGPTYNIRLVADGYMVPNTPAEELAVLAADVQESASRHPSDKLHFEADAEYYATVGSQLPEAPADPRGEDKYEWAAAYKVLGNALFQQGQHAWALRTYLTGVQQLQLQGYGAEDPEQIFGDVRAWPVCTASFSNAALCALKLGRHELAAQCCDRGLRFASSDTARAKLLMRKAQALLHRANPSPGH
jgi:tetratricopeptide (TPR) repeat protein